MSDSDPKATFGYVLEALGPHGLAYVHLMEPNENDLKQDVINPVLSTFRPHYSGTVIANGGFDHEGGDQVLAKGNAELVSFGRLFLATRQEAPRSTRQGERRDESRASRSAPAK